MHMHNAIDWETRDCNEFPAKFEYTRNTKTNNKEQYSLIASLVCKDPKQSILNRVENLFHFDVAFANVFLLYFQIRSEFVSVVKWTISFWMTA